MTEAVLGESDDPALLFAAGEPQPLRTVSRAKESLLRANASMGRRQPGLDMSPCHAQQAGPGSAFKSTIHLVDYWRASGVWEISASLSARMISCAGERRRAMLRFHTILPGLALLVLVLGPHAAGTACAADPAKDPSVTIYGTLNRAAPPELATFSFLVGKWTGTGKYRDAEGKYMDFGVLWIGRYALDGMAIVDENRRPEADGGAIQGLTLRYFDPGTKTWTIEFLNFGQSFLRKQANSTSGAVTREGRKITISQSGPEGAPGREVYTVVDADHFTYSLDVMKDGAWDEGLVTMQLQRQQ